MEIKNLTIDADLEEYIASKGDPQQFINFCIRERRDKMDADWRKPRAMPTNRKDKSKVDAKYRKFLPDDQIIRRDTPFFKKNVVISGVFSRFEYRNDIAALLHPLGVAVNSGIIQATDIAIFGEGAGPKKREEVREINASGGHVEVLTEQQLYEVLDQL